MNRRDHNETVRRGITGAQARAMREFAAFERLGERLSARERPEDEPCERGTPGCSVDHGGTYKATGDWGECEGW